MIVSQIIAKVWLGLWINLHSLIFQPHEGSTTSCKHNIDVISPNKDDMANALAVASLHIQIRSSISIHLNQFSCLCQMTDEF